MQSKIFEINPNAEKYDPAKHNFKKKLRVKNSQIKVYSEKGEYIPLINFGSVKRGSTRADVLIKLHAEDNEVLHNVKVYTEPVGDGHARLGKVICDDCRIHINMNGVDTAIGNGKFAVIDELSVANPVKATITLCINHTDPIGKSFVRLVFKPENDAALLGSFGLLGEDLLSEKKNVHDRYSERNTDICISYTVNP